MFYEYEGIKLSLIIILVFITIVITEKCQPYIRNQITELLISSC